ncbi:FAD-dependent oxidoreductase [Streptomyces sp. NPDC090077]|uniref:FAD-dependent oxidoreductase n=1 Tax=Streptomyces sp. NPDC090077 TaxID=3365938 RepID=UPI003802FCAF
MQHVVVLGGSIAGLAATRALRGQGMKVTIVEPDGLATTGPRGGVPQGGQLHALLDMGRTQAERWFPGLSKDLVADGAVLGSGSEIQLFENGTRKVSVPGNELIGVSRTLLEDHIRRRTLLDDGTSVIAGRACGLDIRGGRVTGVRVRAADPDPDAVTVVPADAVVDATGRSSRLTSWLAAQGWPQPPVDRMRIDLGYATARFRRGGELPGVSVAHQLPPAGASAAEQPDTGAMAAVEGGQWMAVIVAYAENRPSRDPAEFLRRMREMEAGPFGVVADRCTMIGEVETYGMAHSLRRNWWAVDRLPGGLFVAGDAVASFNPVYGQGMTSAFLHASCLAAYLRKGADLHAPAHAYFRHIRVVVDAAWEVSTLSDLAQPHVTGPYPRGYRLARKMADWMGRASTTDAWVNGRFLDVVNMRRRPADLRTPEFWWHVARAMRAQRAQGPQLVRRQRQPLRGR